MRPPADNRHTKDNEMGDNTPAPQDHPTSSYGFFRELALIVDRLTIENYPQWVEDMEMNLRHLRLWGVISGAEPRPVESDLEALEAWNEKNIHAALLIKSRISPELKHMIAGKIDAKDLWDTFDREFKCRGNMAVFNLKKKLFLDPKPDSMSIRDLIAVKRKLQIELGQLGDRVSENDLSLAVLFALDEPTWGQTVRNILEPTNIGDPIQLDRVQAVLTQREAQLNGSTAQAFLTQSKPSKSKKDKQRKGPCTYCQKKNHWESECRKKIADEATKSGNTSDKATVKLATADGSEIYAWTCTNSALCRYRK